MNSMNLFNKKKNIKYSISFFNHAMC